MPIVTRDDHEHALAELAGEIADPRAGIFGPSSVAWRIGGDLAVFLGGGRAALLQLSHPMVAYAVADHSHARSDIVGRFQRTFRAVFAMVFGELDDAVAAARRVYAIHARIHGVLDRDVGGWRAGTAYDANDVDALRWVHATLVDTTLVVRELLDGELPPAIKDAYIVEMNRFARLFGIPHARLPRGFADHAAYMAAMIASDRLAVAPCANQMAAFLLGRGDARQPPLGRVAELVTAMLLPPHLAEQFGLARARVSRAALRVALAAVAPLYARVPFAWRALPAHAQARRRLEGMAPSRIAAWAERELFGLSRRVTGS
jgi:uncharacterized protein (DUF2236 family)